VTFQAPDSDRYGYGVDYLRGRITGALGGRAAEELVYADVTTGAESDLEQVTAIARRMVGRWGMSDEIGPVSVLPGPDDQPLLFPGTGSGPSPRTQELVDEEVRRIVDGCYADAMRLLTANRERLNALARALLERETLDEDDAYEVAGISREAVPAR
jgi:cell division protease FtsH